MKYGLPEKQYDSREKVIAFHQSLLERLRRLPGVTAAGLVSTPPGAGYEGDYVFTLPEHPSSSFRLQNDAINRTADPGYFSTMQIPLIAGRFFTDQERLERDHYLIISKKFADQFPGENPIGKHVTVQVLDGTYEIVGVVGDIVFDVAPAYQGDDVLPDPVRRSATWPATRRL